MENSIVAAVAIMPIIPTTGVFAPLTPNVRTSSSPDRNDMSFPNANLIRPLLVASLLWSFAGCAGFHPIRGIDVDKLHSQYLTPHGVRSHLEPIDFALLGQSKPIEHRVDTGDVLGIFIEGVLGKDEEAPPVFAPGSDTSAPRIGYPVKVREDGTISVPLSEPIYVRGLSLREVEDEIRRVQTGPGGMLAPGINQNSAKIIVSLQKARSYRVMVVRRDRPQDVNEVFDASQINTIVTRKGSSMLVELPAYENDVAHALVLSGGLPGLDAENAVYVMRARGRYCQICAQERLHLHDTPVKLPPANSTAPLPVPMQGMTSPAQTGSEAGWSFPQPQSPTVRGQNIEQQLYQFDSAHEPAQIQLLSHTTYDDDPTVESDFDASFDSGYALPHHSSQALPYTDDYSSCPHQDATLKNSTVLRIPLALYPGEMPGFAPEDVLLYDGDTIFIESRNREFFFTGGLLGGGQYPLPRDYDLDLIGAISLAESRRVLGNKSIGGASVLNQDVTVGASRVVVMRTMPDGLIVPIRVDLKVVKQDPSRSIIIQPGDRIFLQYTKPEACAAFFERHLFDGLTNGFASGFAFGAFGD